MKVSVNDELPWECVNKRILKIDKICICYDKKYKKLGYCRGNARCVVSIEILPIASQQCRTTYTTSPDQIDGMKLEI